MRFRWASSFSTRASAAALAALVIPSLAHATITVTSLQSTTTNTAFFFAGKAGGPPLTAGANGQPAFVDSDPNFPRFNIIDYNKSAAANAGGNLEGGDPPDGIQFNISTNNPNLGNPAGTITVLVVRVSQSSGATGSGSFAPIAAANGAACSSANCASLGINTNAGENYFFGAIYAGNPITVTLMPKDICQAANDVNVTVPGATTATTAWIGFVASGCDTGGIVSATSPTQMFVKFSLIAVPDPVSAPTGVTAVTAAASLDDGPASTTLNFQSDSPSLATCPGFNDAANIYFPGDASILLQTGQFPLTQAVAGEANGDSIVVVGATGATVPAAYVSDLTSQATTTAALNKSQFSLTSRVPYNSGSQAVTGFNNSVNATDANTYSLIFLVRDQAGLVAAPVSPTCSLTGVRTTNIQGFLTKGSCFIATAAFQDYEHGPVEMLRRFRDRVLLKALPGRAFVKWYYGWSPDAAEWLMRHPAFRYPVLLALVPVEALAWLGLHPPVLALLALAGASLFFSVIYVRQSTPLRRAQGRAKRYARRCE